VGTSADIAIERAGEWTVARVAGELDMSNCADAREDLTRATPADGDGLVVELTETAYLDSAAIELLFELARRLGRRRQALRIVMPDDSPLRRVLELTDVRAVAPVHASLEAALGAPA